MASQDATCPNGHKLDEFTTPNEGYLCDMCGKKLPSNSTMLGCRPCNFDKCGDCRSKDVKPIRLLEKRPTQHGATISKEQDKDMAMFPVGTDVMYYSISSGNKWLQASVLGHRSDGSYILDIQRQAAANKVRLRPGATAEYYSTSNNAWIDCKVQNYNNDDLTYILDVHPRADPAKVRVREREESRCYIVGGKQIWASSASEALAKASKAAKDGQLLAGFPQVKSLKSLPDEAKQFYNLMSTLINDGSQSSLLQQEATKYFKACDMDGDGKINEQELKNLVYTFAKRLSLPQVDLAIATKLFHRHDLNRSGFIEEIEFSELFKRLIRRMLAGMKVASQHTLLRSSKARFDEKYELTKRLNAGAGGVTHLGRDKASGETVVVKKPHHHGDIDDFEKLRDKSHPNLVKVFELFNSPSETWIVMEFCKGGDLFSVLAFCREKFGSTKMSFCSAVMDQTLRGIKYIHEEFKECHNDIKPENILLDRKPTSATDVPRVMVADFGCASGLESDRDGDPRYNAPELWKEPPSPVSYETDVWALGVMLYEMLSGGILIFTGQANISGWGDWLTAQNGQLLQRFKANITVPNAQPDWALIEPCGGDAVQLCKNMLAYDPSKRITIDGALHSSWVRTEHDANFQLPNEIVDKLRKRTEMSEMKMLLLNLVAARIQGENLRYYEKLWREVDTNHDGTLSREEFMRLLLSHGFNRFQAEDIFLLADLDASGSVNFNEFVAVMFNPDAMTQAQLSSHCILIFGHLFNGAEMSLNDFSKVFPGCTSAELLSKLFHNIDKDKNGKVSLEEFVDFVSQM